MHDISKITQPQQCTEYSRLYVSETIFQSIAFFRFLVFTCDKIGVLLFIFNKTATYDMKANDLDQKTDERYILNPLSFYIFLHNF